MKPNKMTLRQQVEYYQNLLALSKDANDIMMRQNQSMQLHINDLTKDVELLKKIVAKLVDK